MYSISLNQKIANNSSYIDDDDYYDDDNYEEEEEVNTTFVNIIYCQTEKDAQEVSDKLNRLVAFYNSVQEQGVKFLNEYAQFTEVEPDRPYPNEEFYNYQNLVNSKSASNQQLNHYKKLQKQHLKNLENHSEKCSEYYKLRQAFNDLKKEHFNSLIKEALDKMPIELAEVIQYLPFNNEEEYSSKYYTYNEIIFHKRF